MQIYRELAKRHWEVARLCAMGLTHKQVAQRLKLEPETVKTYIKEIRQRTSLHSQSQFWMLFSLSQLEVMKHERAVVDTRIFLADSHSGG